MSPRKLFVCIAVTLSLIPLTGSIASAKILEWYINATKPGHERIGRFDVNARDIEFAMIQVPHDSDYRIGHVSFQFDPDNKYAAEFCEWSYYWNTPKYDPKESPWRKGYKGSFDLPNNVNFVGVRLRFRPPNAKALPYVPFLGGTMSWR